MIKSKKNQSSKQRLLRSVTIGLGVVSASILGFFLTRAETGEDVARKVLACVERGDGACVNKYRWELDKRDQPISDAEMSRFLREFMDARLSLNAPLEAPKVAVEGSSVTIERRYRGGVIVLTVEQTAGGFRAIHPVTGMILSSYHGTQRLSGSTKVRAWVDGLTKDKALLNSYGIVGLEFEPNKEFETIDDYCRRLTVRLSNPIPTLKP
ncbi:hypothetical protein MCEMSE15_00893 [Fimbriimonadaceae bacterium]